MSQSNPPTNAPPGAGDRSPWQRLMLMARPRATKANAFAALLAILLGFAVATQVRQNQVVGLESLRQSELVTILDNATLLSSRLDQNARELQATRDELVSGSTGDAAALKAAQERLDALGVLAGTARAHGPGIQMTIGDPGAKVTPPAAAGCHRGAARCRRRGHPGGRRAGGGQLVLRPVRIGG